MITGEDFAKYFSDNEGEYNENEKLYSTGDEELDDLLERAFSEGYEYAQREFANVTSLVGKLPKKPVAPKVPTRIINSSLKNLKHRPKPSTFEVQGLSQAVRSRAADKFIQPVNLQKPTRFDAIQKNLMTVKRPTRF